jgi:Predicted O-methyltransferase
MNLLELAESIGVTGFLHCDELQKLVELAANRDVLEVGSYRGLSAWGMSIAAKSVTCVDTFKACTNGQRQEEQYTTLDAFTAAVRRYAANRVRAHLMASEVAAPVIGDQTFDMIFLDAMHTYEDVRADINRWLPKLRAGGVFVLHDYRHADFPGVEKAADEIFGPAPEGTTLVTLRWIQKP